MLHELISSSLILANKHSGKSRNQTLIKFAKTLGSGTESEINKKYIKNISYTNWSVPKILNANTKNTKYTHKICWEC